MNVINGRLGYGSTGMLDQLWIRTNSSEYPEVLVFIILDEAQYLLQLFPRGMNPEDDLDAEITIEKMTWRTAVKESICLGCLRNSKFGLLRKRAPSDPLGTIEVEMNSPIKSSINYSLSPLCLCPFLQNPYHEMYPTSSKFNQDLPTRPWGVVALALIAMKPPARQMTPLKMDTSKNPPYFSSNTPFTGGPTKVAVAATAIPIPM